MVHLFRAGAAAFFGHLMICAISLAAIPGADNPHSFTQHDYLKATLDYNRRTLVDAYRAIGSHDPKWDDDAIRFLDGMAVRFSNAGLGGSYRSDNIPTPDALIQTAEAARAKGCKDPMVAYCYATLLNDTGRREQAKPLLAEAVTGVMSSHYSVARAMFVALRHAKSLARAKGEADAWSKYQDCVLATLMKKDFQNLDRRVIFNQWYNSMNDIPHDQLQSIVKAAHELNNPDAWLVDMIEGHARVQAAWDARGSGWASSVTPQGWQIFHDELSKARDCLVDAWKLQPTYPESATAMITIGMAGDLNEDSREWFDRAAQAQFDYEQAYTSYTYSLTPRWGGSVRAMYDFGLECLATHRFDTSVPWKYLYTLTSIAQDQSTPDFWSAHGVLEHTEEVCEGYIKEARRPESINYFKSYEAAVAYRGTDFGEAVKLMDSIKEPPATHPFEQMLVMPRLAISHAYTMADPVTAKVYYEAEGHASSDDLDGAIKVYRTTVASAGSAKSAYFLASRLKQLEWEKQFTAGQWVDITPKADMLGWEAEDGKWHVDADGTVVGTADLSGLTLAFQGIFMQPRYEVEMTFLAPQTPSQSVGMSLSLYDPRQFVGFVVRKLTQGARFENQWGTMPPNKVDLAPASNIMLLAHWDRYVRVELNEQPYVRMQAGADDDRMDNPQLYFAVGGRLNPVGSELRIKTIRLHKLTEEPGH